MSRRVPQFDRGYATAINDVLETFKWVDTSGMDEKAARAELYRHFVRLREAPGVALRAQPTSLQPLRPLSDLRRLLETTGAALRDPAQMQTLAELLGELTKEYDIGI